jgi:hypothetical protein
VPVFEEFSFRALMEAHGCPSPPIARRAKTGNQFIFNDFSDLAVPASFLQQIFA